MNSVFKKLAVVALMTAAAMQAQATSTTATLTINGTVNAILYVGFDAAGSSVTNTVNLTSTQMLGGFTNVSAGTVYEVTNNAGQNYDITVTSANGGKIKHPTVNTSFVSYTMTYGSLFTNSSLASPVSNTVNTSAITGLTTTSRAVSISSAGNANALASTGYSDTVTFVVTAI